MRFLLFSLVFLASAVHADSLERFKSFLRDTQSARASRGASWKIR